LGHSDQAANRRRGRSYVRCDLEALAGTASDVGGYAGQLLGPDILVIHHGKRAWRGLMIIPVLLGARTSVCVPLTPGEYIWAGFNPALSAIVFAVHMIFPFGGLGPDCLACVRLCRVSGAAAYLEQCYLIWCCSLPGAGTVLLFVPIA